MHPGLGSRTRLTPELSRSSVEALTNILWLASWATFASYASAINLPGAGRTFPPPPETTVDGPSQVLDFTWSTASEVMAAKVAVAVDAAIGAVIWVLFCITLFATGMSTLCIMLAPSRELMPIPQYCPLSGIASIEKE
jgi:hypothetical protein